MKKEQVLLLLGLVWFISIVYYVYYHGNDNYVSHHKRVYICNPDDLSKIEKELIAPLPKTKGDDWYIFQVCSMQNIEQELSSYKKKFHARKKPGWVMGIDRIDSFAAKDRLWAIMKAKYGTEATQWVPETWLINDPSFVFEAGHTYIAKRNTQRQTGLKLVKSIAEFHDIKSDGYVVIQKILRDPFLIDGRKINIRAYILLTCFKGVQKAYVHNQGLLYYGREKYGDGTQENQIITSGYVPREIYDTHPLTTADFYKTIGYQQSSEYVRQRNETLTAVFDAFKGLFCGDNGTLGFCQLLGADLQPDAHLKTVKLIEMNKGPSLEIMDDRDGQLKRNVIEDVYEIIGVPMKTNGYRVNGFSLFWTSEM